MKKLISMTLVALMVVFTMTGCKKSYTIIVKSNNDAWGTVTGSGTYKEGETVTISAVPADGYYFISWNDGDKSNPRQIVVSGNAEYIATFSDTPDGGGNDTPGIIHNAVTDIDGNHYDAVKIGDQVWMAENLRTTHYADGTAIPGGENEFLTDICYPDPYYCINSDLDAIACGYFYNWPAAMHGAASSNTVPSGVQGVCPNGWHLPSDAEWTILTDYVSSQSEYTCDGISNNIAKALASIEGWATHEYDCVPGNDQTSNNATGFGAVPAGVYWLGNYRGFGGSTSFWSSTEKVNGIENAAYGRSLFLFNPGVSQYDTLRSGGLSVRCVRD